MGNKNYISGRRREYKIINDAKADALKTGENIITIRAAGSHSPIDLVLIYLDRKIIKFIQVKDYKVYGKEKAELEKLKDFSDEYFVEFKAWTEADKIDKRKKGFRNKDSERVIQV